jgi:uncharacterized membrane-anchored protein YhcB (DUF1043 family)
MNDATDYEKNLKWQYFFYGLIVGIAIGALSFAFMNFL